MDLITLCNQRDNIILFAKERLTDEHQRVFAEHFMLSFTNSTDEFPISGDRAMEWLDYKMKHKFKEFVVKNTTENIHYKIIFTRSGENKAGRNNELIKLSIEGFKLLEMFARTKKGDIIRSYYPQLEKLMYEYGIDQHRKMLDEANNKTKNLELALKAERANYARAANRGVIKDTPENVVYIMEGASGHKIGESGNCYRREGDLKNGGVHNKIVYTKKCHNKRILEKLTHHILNEYRISNTREWFDVPFEIAKHTLDCTQLFMDSLLNKGKEMYEHNFHNQLQDLISSLPGSSKSITEYTQIPNDGDLLSDDEDDVPITTDLDDDINDPLDFGKFIEECCIKGDDLTSYSVDIFGAHRLWGRCCEKSTHDAFYEYLNKNYKKVKVFDTDTQATLSSYKGFSLKPISYRLIEPIDDIDEFIESKCKLSYNARLPTKEMYTAFEAWKKETTHPDYVMNSKERQRVDHGFGMRLLCAKVYNGTCSVLGYFGICLKDNDNHVGLKLAHKLKKKVVKVDITTKQIVETYESLSAASIAIGKTASYLSQDIRFKKPHGNYIFKFL